MTVLRSALLLLVALLPSLAGADPARISHLLRSEALFPVLQQEGAVYGEDLHSELVGAVVDAGWHAEVMAIHAPGRLLPEFDRSLAAALAGADLPAIEAWLEAPLARRVIDLEIHTRKALLDPSAEDAALRQAGVAAEADDPKLAAVRRVIAASDLIETNVVGGLNANLAFYRAMAAGNAFPYEVSEGDMLADVAGQEAEIRADVTAWIESYLFAAYQPLSVAELDEIARFNASAPGRALLRAEFAAFDAVYESTSAALGAALARRITSSEL